MSGKSCDLMNHCVEVSISCWKTVKRKENLDKADMYKNKTNRHMLFKLVVDFAHTVCPLRTRSSDKYDLLINAQDG